MCVLIVEDEPLIRCIVAEEFSEAGFDVRSAENGDEATTLIENAPAAFSLLITDVQMPGTRDGIAVARLMRRRHPRVPVIYMTGRPDALSRVRPLGDTEAVVAKPFVPSDLLRVARRLLGNEDTNGRGR